MDDDGKVWKWEVWPHPYSNEFDFFVTDSDDEARDAISNLAEMYLWDGNDGGERIVKVVHNDQASGGGVQPLPLQAPVGQQEQP